MRPKITNYRDLEVWQQAMDLVVKTYQITRELPAQERFGLSSQMQRAAVSVPANLAEGHGRRHRGEFLQHTCIARASLMELETHLLICQRLGYITEEQLRTIWELSQVVGRLLNGLIRSLAKEPRPLAPDP